MSRRRPHPEICGSKSPRSQVNLSDSVVWNRQQSCCLVCPMRRWRDAAGSRRRRRLVQHRRALRRPATRAVRRNSAVQQARQGHAKKLPMLAEPHISGHESPPYLQARARANRGRWRGAGGYCSSSGSQPELGETTGAQGPCAQSYDCGLARLRAPQRSRSTPGAVHQKPLYNCSPLVSFEVIRFQN